ncbi:LysR family transcriptional regulator [Neogemmobacter tilapiae]|uniref:LysR family transcriptional regulator n=1 Tax=Neogemmobacter tilapiae TaxID=875041 RepID=A0A918WGC9_9RHOB|nr:LysR family transcriptional regulator [Gemmobacter tilapiae]GHC48868.1 LysR family transcriptional regulator [Gemmobacter tilapiae]
MAEPQGRITLWGIEVFLAAAEEGSVSAAARRLGVSASAVSQQLAGLEAALGAVLIDRAARPLQMTAAGQRFRIHAQVMLNAASEARVDMALADPGAGLTLRLGMIEDFEGSVTPALLSALAGDLRTSRFLLETGPSHRLHDQLEARALDLVVAADLEGEGEGFDVFPLLAEPFLRVAPLHGPADLPLIRYSARQVMGRQIAQHLTRQGLQFPSRVEADSYAAILAMVAAGAGWAILPPLALHHAGALSPALVVEPLPFAPLSRRISLTARQGVLRDMPERVAFTLRDLLQVQVVGPMAAQFPWLAGELRVL